MKPILLKIEGLNSFSEKQEIDFEYLTQRGVFGIFGATGSGKSTILDAIILALYGKVPRSKNELGEAINVNKDFIDIYFKFSIAGEIYSVRRIIERTKQGVSTKHSVIYDKNEKALTEKSGETNAKIEELLGLSAEDFTRSVVLPQGQFSEFLKLGAKPRRDMVERIFNLREYGTELNNKIKLKLQDLHIEDEILKEKISIIEGNSDVSFEQLEENYKEFEKIKIESENLYLKKEIEYNEKKRDWEDFQDLEKLKEEKFIFDKEENYYKELEKELLKVKAAIDLKKDYEYLEKLEIDLNDCGKSISEKNEKFIKSKENLNKLKSKMENLEKLKEKRVPEIVKRIEDLKKIIELNEEKNKNLDLIKKFEIELNELEIKEKNLENEQNLNLVKREELDQEIEKLKIEIKNNENNPEFRKKIEKLHNRTIKNDELEERREKNLLKMKSLENEIKKTKEKFENSEKKYGNILKEKEKKEIDLVIMKEFILLDEKKFEIDKLEKSLELINENIVNNINRIGEIEKNIVECKKEKNEEEKKLEDLEYQGKAAVLADKLEKNKECPVCGSKEHPKPAKHNGLNTDDIKNKISELELKIRDCELEKEKNNLELTYKNKENNDLLEKIKEIGINYNSKRYIEIKSKIDTDINLYSLEQEIKEFQENMLKLSEEKISFKTILEKDKKLYLDYEKDDISLKKEILENIKEINEEKMTIKEIKDNYISLEEKDKRSISLKLEFEKKEDRKDKYNFDLDKINIEINKKDILKAQVIEKRNFSKNLKKEIIKKLELFESTGEEKNEMEKINKEKNFINEEYNLNKKELSFIELENKNLNEECLSLNEKIKNLTKYKNEQEQKFQEGFKKLNFEKRDEFKKYLWEKEKYQNKSEDLLKYKEKIMKLAGNIEKISRKIEGRKIDQNIWEKVNLEFKDLKENDKKINEKLVLIKQEIERVKKDLDKLKDLKKDYKKLQKDLSNFEDLKDLFKANKFVDYIAKQRLDYIAKEASKRLKEISRGRYALEINYQGNFIIRDDFNGGARRNTSTLSGGEQFLTSLSLALALSNHIQLKGNACLEFFFLDEGFGTLDNELLDLVINSLESIQSENLHIGIISHVEEIKQRISRKVLVKAAINSYQGSRIEIE